jgi:hypothetical protein
VSRTVQEARLITLFRLMDSGGRDETLISAASRVIDDLLPDFSPTDVWPKWDGLLPSNASIATSSERVNFYHALKDGLDATGDAYSTLLGTSLYDDQHVPRFTHAAGEEAFRLGLWFTSSDEFSAKCIHAWRWEVIQELKQAAEEREKEREGQPSDDNTDWPGSW